MGTRGPFPGVKRGRGVTLTTHRHLVPRSWMSRSYTPLPPAPPCCVVGLLYFLKSNNYIWTLYLTTSIMIFVTTSWVKWSSQPFLCTEQRVALTSCVTPSVQDVSRVRLKRILSFWQHTIRLESPLRGGRDASHW